MGGIPSNYTVDVNLDLVTPVDLTGLPTNYHVDIGSLPKIQIGLDPITINPITLKPLDITLNPLDIAVRVTEAPSIRAHVPANFTLGFSLLGLQLACIRLCGEAQVITEPYVPNPCEPCGAVPRPVPLPVSNLNPVNPKTAAVVKRAGKV
jgi:hypothetical protein